MAPNKDVERAEKKASDIADKDPGNYGFRWIWLLFLVLYPFIFTFSTFCTVWLDGVGFMEVPVSVLWGLIGKTMVTDLGIISYVVITESLFPRSSPTKILVQRVV